MKEIPLASPNITEEDIEAVNMVLRSGQLVQGKNVIELEKNVANFVGTTYGRALSNGTATLHLALISLGIKAGDEVIVPAFSYVATANAVELVGATPVFVDIEIDTFNIDVNKLEKAITSKTKAIIPVHEFGLAADMAAIIELVRGKNIFVIEDAACALGATQNGISVGSFGECASFSFHPRKAITSGEGGMITTNNQQIANKISILRNHGIEMIDNKMEFVEAGFNYRMTDFQAALVNSQMNRLSNIIKFKNELANIYFDKLNIKKYKLPSVPSGYMHTWQTFHILILDQGKRDVLIHELKQKGIGSNYGAQCIPEQIYYKRKYNLNSHNEFPNTLNAYQNGLAIPIYEKLDSQTIIYISEVLNNL